MGNKRGRPPVDPQRTKGVHLDIRLSEDEKEAFKKAAELEGLALSVWIRQRLRKAARKELEDAGVAVPFLLKARNQTSR